MNPATVTQAQSFLGELQERGITLRPTHEGNLRYRPKSAVSPEDVQRIKEHKRDLLDIFRLGQSIELSPPSPPSPHGDKPGNCRESGGDSYGDGTTVTNDPEFVRRRRQKAAELGLVARWGYEHGFISIHDPTTGEWHDLALKDAPVWAKDEAFKRRDLYKAGEKRFLTQAELEEIWANERSEDEGIVDGVGAAMDSKGLVFED